MESLNLEIGRAYVSRETMAIPGSSGMLEHPHGRLLTLPNENGKAWIAHSEKGTITGKAILKKYLVDVESLIPVFCIESKEGENWDYYLDPQTKEVYYLSKAIGCASGYFGSLDYYNQRKSQRARYENRHNKERNVA